MGLRDRSAHLAASQGWPTIDIRHIPACSRGSELGRCHPRRDTPERRILQVLTEADGPLSQRQIRERAAIRPKTVAEALSKLVRETRVERTSEGGYRLVAGGPESGAATDEVNGRSPGRPLPKTVTALNLARESNGNG